MKKRLLAIALAAVLALGLAGCGDISPSASAQEPAPQKTRSLYEHGLEMVALMDEMVRSDAYMGAYTSSGEVLAEVEKVRAGSYAGPKAVYRLSLSLEDLLDEFIASGGAGDLSPALRESLQSRLSSALVTQINAMGGASMLAASSLCTAGKTFLCPELAAPTVYLYTYENALPVAIVFAPGEDGAASASGTFLLYPEFPCASVEDISGFFQEYGIPAEVETVDIPAA